MNLRIILVVSLVATTTVFTTCNVDAVTVYVNSIAPQVIPQNGGPSVGDRLVNEKAMLEGTLFQDWQHYETRGPGNTSFGAGPAANGTPQMLQNNALLVSTPAPVLPFTGTKVTIGMPILKNPNATIVNPTGGVSGVEYYNTSDYLTYADLVAGRVTLSYSYHNPLDVANPEAAVIGFETSRYPSQSLSTTELKFEPANNSTKTDQSSASNGNYYNNPDRWITTQNILAGDINWNVGGTNSGQIGGASDALDTNFNGSYLLNLLISMGSGTNGRMSWIDNVTIAYDGTNGGTAFSYTYDFGDLEATPPAPEPGSLVLLGLGSLLLVAKRRRN